MTSASGVGLLNMVEVVPIIVIFVAEGCFSVFFAVVPNRFGIHPRQKCLGGRSIPKRGKKSSFWDLPHLEGPPGHINPKTIWNNARQAAPRRCPRRCPRRRQGNRQRAAGRRRSGRRGGITKPAREGSVLLNIVCAAAGQARQEPQASTRLGRRAAAGQASSLARR